jgi:protein-S-isoprenylcysteine O-methyltransferase Ste14
MKTRLKINGILIALAVLLTAAFPAVFMRHEPVALREEILEISGIAFILLGQIIRVSSRGYKSEHSSQGAVLIQGGPYALVRNPMYLGIFLIGLGIVLVLFNWWVICLFLLAFISRYLLLIFKEEKKLSAAFPADYPDYKRRVPRILPSLPTILRKDISSYLPIKPAWIKKEIGTISAVLLFTLLMESWEDIKNEGWAIYKEEALTIIITIILFIALLMYLSRRTKSIAENGTNKSKSN